MTAHKAAAASALTRFSRLTSRFALPFLAAHDGCLLHLKGADSYQSQVLDAAETALFNSQTASNDNVLTTLANMTNLVVCASFVIGFWACQLPDKAFADYYCLCGTRVVAILQQGGQQSCLPPL